MTKHPTGLYVLFFTEMWERFSFYGMRALLMLYMVEALHYPTATAGTLYGLYTCCVYLTPIVGGWIADRFWGQQRCILVGGALMAAGHFVMVWPQPIVLLCALGLLVAGNGLFKPNVSIIVGKLYDGDGDAGGDARREAAFNIFYMGINVGAFLAPLVCGALGQRIGWHWGFAAAGIGMLVSLATFGWGRRHLAGHGASPAPRVPTSPGRNVTAPPDRVIRQRMAVLAVLASIGNVVFWAAFEQAGSSMTLFAAHAVDLRLPGSPFSVPSSWFVGANGLYICILAPAFSWLWLHLYARGCEPSTPVKFVFGLLLLSAGFYTMTRAGVRADAGARVGMGWLLAAYFFNTCGELCVSPVGLAAVTRLAPQRLQAFIMGLWMASMALGNGLAGRYAAYYRPDHAAAFFAVPAWATLVTALALWALAAPLRRGMHGVH